MYNKKLRTLFFPHIILGNILAGTEYSGFKVRGKLFPLSEFNLVQNDFFGGNIENLCLIKELGFYVCFSRHVQKKINGFYIPEPDMITDVGKEVLAAHFPNVTIIYEKMSATPHKVFTEKEIQKKLDLLNEAKEHGIDAKLLEKDSIDEIENQIDIKKSGKADGVKASITTGVMEVEQNASLTLRKNEDPNAVSSKKMPIKRSVRT